jgi:hypothetical protein
VIEPQHILMYKDDNGQQVHCIGVSKRDGKWGILGKPMQIKINEFEGWLKFLHIDKRMTTHFADLDKAQESGVPLIASAPGESQNAAFEAAAWFTVLLHTP